MNNFTFVGNILFDETKQQNKINFQEPSEARDWYGLGFGIKASDNNCEFVGISGGIRDTIVTIDKFKERMEIDWNDRFDKDILEDVSFMRKYIADLEGNWKTRREFLSSYDFIQYLKDALLDFKSRVVVEGEFKITYSNKSKIYYHNFNIRRIRLAKETDKNGFYLNATVYYNANSFDGTDLEKDDTGILSGYIAQYSRDKKGIEYYLQNIVLNTSKIDKKNPKHIARLNRILDYMKINKSALNEDGKKSFKKKTVVCMNFNMSYFRGAEGIPFDESLLTDKQREQIELGFNTIEDFQKNVKGANKIEIKVLSPDLKLSPYTDGIVDTGTTIEEFEKDVFVPAKIEASEDILDKSGNGEAEDEDTDMDDLFD